MNQADGDDGGRVNYQLTANSEFDEKDGSSKLNDYQNQYQTIDSVFLQEHDKLEELEQQKQANDDMLQFDDNMQEQKSEFSKESKSERQTRSHSNNINSSSTGSLTDSKKSKKSGRLSRIASMFKKENKKKEEEGQDVFFEAYAPGTDVKATNSRSKHPQET